MPELHLLWIAHAVPEAEALARRLKPALTRLIHPIMAPALALAIGAALPPVARFALIGLPAVAAGLIFCAVSTAGRGRTNRAEAFQAAAILHVCMLACPAAIAAGMTMIGVGSGLTGAAMMVAGSPVSLGGGMVAERFGLPGRPVVWAAVMGLAFVPASLPLVAAVCGTSGLPPPGALAAAAVVIAGLPLSAALGARRLIPGGIDACREPLRLALILCLAVLACSAGGRAVAALSRPGGWAGCATGLGVQAIAAAVAWGIGRSLATLNRSPPLGPQLVLASAMRNSSVVWAACLAAGGISPMTEAVVSTFVAVTFLAPLAAFVWAARRRATAPRRPR